MAVQKGEILGVVVDNGGFADQPKSNRRSLSRSTVAGGFGIHGVTETKAEGHVDWMRMGGELPEAALDRLYDFTLAGIGGYEQDDVTCQYAHGKMPSVFPDIESFVAAIMAATIVESE